MNSNLYNKEYLISELHRFVRENSKNPTYLNMQGKFGYPGYSSFQNYFGSWNNALIEAGLKINNKHQIGFLDGTETCNYCNKRANEIPNFTNWYYHDNIRYCQKHGYSPTGGLPDYVKGELDINCSTGFGRAGEICVLKTLKIGNEYDCNRLSCKYKIDMYSEEYGKIDVKIASLLDGSWVFIFDPEKDPDTYICLGMILDKKYVERVWIVPNEGKIRDLQTFSVANAQLSLFNRKKWEVDAKPYDESWREMLDNYTNGNCKIFGTKEYIF